jgi:hypothetical protein
MMLSALGDLREWLCCLRMWANEAADVAVVPDEPDIPHVPELPKYEYVSLGSMYETLVNMQHLREQWDLMVRLYEADWDCKHAVVMRLQLVRLAYTILAQAFLTPEIREAKQEQYIKKAEKFMRKMLIKMGVPKELLGKGSAFMMTPFGPQMQLEQKEEIDFDALFHGESPKSEDDDEEDSPSNN